VSEISGVVDPDRTSFISDGTSTPLSTARAHVRSHSDDDLEEEMSPRHSGDQSEEYCKEVQCIEMEESTRDINNDSEERTDAETLLGHNAEANGETGSAQHRIPSSVRSVRRRKSWSRGDTMTGTSTPPDALETDYRGRPEGHGFAFPDLEFGSGGKLLRNDSMTSRGSDSTEAHSIGTPLVGEEGGITSIRSFVEGLKEMVKTVKNTLDIYIFCYKRCNFLCGALYSGFGSGEFRENEEGHWCGCYGGRGVWDNDKLVGGIRETERTNSGAVADMSCLVGA